MAPKQAAKEPAPSSIPPSVAAPSHGQTSGSSQPTKPAVKSSSSVSNRPAKTPPTSLRNAQDAQEILVGIWNRYVEETPQRVKLMDVFMAFLVVVGVLQFVYCIVAGNYVRLISPPLFPGAWHGEEQERKCPRHSGRSPRGGT